MSIQITSTNCTALLAYSFNNFVYHTLVERKLCSKLHTMDMCSLLGLQQDTEKLKFLYMQWNPHLKFVSPSNICSDSHLQIQWHQFSTTMNMYQEIKELGALKCHTTQNLVLRKKNRKLPSCHEYAKHWKEKPYSDASRNPTEDPMTLFWVITWD
jgi:hypothetical protein